MDVIQAHKHCTAHRAVVESSDLCGCFYCLGVFKPSEIAKWVDSENTALCPKCGIDSVIGSQSEVPLTPEFLGQMRHHWFEK
jgi:hypothetical protein